MDVAVTGSTGFLGEAVVAGLVSRGHRVRRVVRGPAADGDVRWDPLAGTVDLRALDGVDGVVHLAGESIGSHRWTDEQKRRIRESRTRGTDVLARALAGLERRPAVLVSASAIGYYGDRGDEQLTEESPPGDDFLARVCVAWEEATAPAAEAGVRVATVRTGIVLDPGGGALGRMLLPFKLGLGGRIGSGDQWMSWISLPDEVGAIVHAVEQDAVRGAVNLTAPAPVTNRELTSTLGRVLGRPTLLPTPLAPLRARYGGELVSSLLLFSQRVAPTVLVGTGFGFRHPELEGALRAVLGR